MGVVLNRPSTVTVSEAVPQLEEAIDALEPVYVGGPVQASSVVFLAEFVDPAAAGLLVLGRIGFPSPEAGLERLAAATERRRVFAGHAGWGPGQLDAEIENGDWITHDAEPRGRLHGHARGALEQRAHAQGRKLRADRADACRSQRQLSARPRPRSPERPARPARLACAPSPRSRASAVVR